jgi:manganese-dependent inorganic pyrophosphatase
MPEIIVIGHRNPDTDSICAAWCYARFKTSIDPAVTYIPAVCGPLQAQAKFVFQLAKAIPPRHIKDVQPRVIDITRTNGIRLDINDPIMMAFADLDEHTISVIPVFKGNDVFAGIIGVHEMTRYFVAGSLRSRPLYILREENIAKVLPGYFLKQGRVPEFSAPIMIGAMSFADSIRRVKELEPVKPIMVVGLRPDIINYALDNQLPALILTGIASTDQLDIDFSAYNGAVFVSECDTAETVRLLRLSVPVKHIMDSSPLTLSHNELFDDAKKILLASEYRGLPVVRDGQFVGVVTRRSFIEKPRRKLILVDHNELSQSIPGAEDAEICEIIDHHRLGAEKTSMPIYVYSKPIGSTCSIIYGHFRMHGVEIDLTTARLLLSGLLSDTMLLKSPTTTEEDRTIAIELAHVAEVNLQEYGALMLSQTAVLKNTDPMQLITADFKEYTENGLNIGIGQAEVSSLVDINDVKDRILGALNSICRERNLDWAMVLVTDIFKAHSILLTTAFPSAENELSYKRLEDNMYDLPEILSRKKQLLPEILCVMELMRKT